MFLDQLCDRFGIWPFELNASNTLDSERFDHDHACSFLLFFCLKVLKNVSIHLLQDNASLTEYSLLDVLHDLPFSTFEDASSLSSLRILFVKAVTVM